MKSAWCRFHKSIIQLLAEWDRFILYVKTFKLYFYLRKIHYVVWFILVYSQIQT